MVERSKITIQLALIALGAVVGFASCFTILKLFGNEKPKSDNKNSRFQNETAENETPNRLRRSRTIRRDSRRLGAYFRDGDIHLQEQTNDNTEADEIPIQNESTPNPELSGDTESSPNRERSTVLELLERLPTTNESTNEDGETIERNAELELLSAMANLARNNNNNNTTESNDANNETSGNASLTESQAVMEALEGFMESLRESIRNEQEPVIHPDIENSNNNINDDVLNGSESLSNLLSAGAINRNSSISAVRNRRNRGKKSKKNSEAEAAIVDLLYLLADYKKKHKSIIHRGVTCDECNMYPVVGVRYKCTQCPDFDICENCEAKNSHREHVMLKIKIPVPSIMNDHAPILDSFYPGNMLTAVLSNEEISDCFLKALKSKPKFTAAEIHALYDEYCALADYEDEIHGINRNNFQKCIGVYGTKQTLLADMLFKFYDKNNDGLITFDEMIVGMGILLRGSRIEKANSIFRVYDLDSDGMISWTGMCMILTDILSFSRQSVQEMMSFMNDNILISPSDILPDQPISSAFTGTIPADSESILDKEVANLRREVLLLRQTAAARSQAMEFGFQDEHLSENPDLVLNTHNISEDADLNEESLKSSIEDTQSSDDLDTLEPSEIDDSSTSQQAGSSTSRDSADITTNSASESEGERKYTNKETQIYPFSVYTESEGEIPLESYFPNTKTMLNFGNTDIPKLFPSKEYDALNDPTDTDDWPVMDLLVIDAVKKIVDDLFSKVPNRKNSEGLSLSEFIELVKKDPRPVEWFEVLGPVF
ncbi:hypothetical protein BB559_001923 [Furculomyces boomerangus]|uniref:Uncharacterized protein n=1 Tax=Furculomyces boomerangus TaxID=61424 RepID=A0A2T9YZH7_9FUNG|nr:hypothetical protein BB559_001923 [Furculomyces boomerangus]